MIISKSKSKEIKIYRQPLYINAKYEVPISIMYLINIIEEMDTFHNFERRTFYKTMSMIVKLYEPNVRTCVKYD